MGEFEPSSDESGDLLRLDCLRALGFGVGDSPVVVLGSPARFSSEDAEASLFRFEADLGGGSSTKTAEFLVINTRHETRCEHEHTGWLGAKKKRGDKIRASDEHGRTHPRLGSVALILLRRWADHCGTWSNSITIASLVAIARRGTQKPRTGVCLLLRSRAPCFACSHFEQHQP